MKKTIISLCTLGALVSTGCSDDYLNVAPEDDVSTSTIFSTTELLDAATNGLSQIMSDTYSSSGFGRQGYNGEATISLWYGTYKSSDAQYSNATSYVDIVNCNAHELATTGATVFPWYYYYKLISNANAIILHGNEADGAQDEKDFYIGQEYVYRAHAYTQLVALYSKRWVDSRNGESRGVPLRLDDSTGDILCASLGEVYDQIYSDLDKALELFGQSSLTRGNKLWRTDASIAHGVYSRAALAKQDWATAATHAAEARKGYNLMGTAEYWKGFNTPNDEWMWETYTDATENLGVYGFFAYVGANTGSSKGYKNIGSIDKGLIEQIPAEDTRYDLFMVPKEGESGWSTSDSGRATKGDFYDRVKSEYADRIDKSTYIYAYMCTKYQKIDDRSIGCTCLMRAAEMIYNEAEALYMQGGNEAKVRSLLEEAVKPYQPNYTCNLSGQALLDEVKLYKRFDLWGEGRHYFDQKRWNVDMVRKGWNDGGNWHPQFAGSGVTGGSYDTKGKNNWCICIPNREVDYNKLINYNIEPENWTKDSPQQ